MPLHPLLAEKMGKLCAPSATLNDKFKGHDRPFVTNPAGEPVRFLSANGNQTAILPASGTGAPSGVAPMGSRSFTATQI